MNLKPFFNKDKYIKGLTLIESLVYILIFSITIGVIGSFGVWMQNNFYRAQKIEKAIEETDAALQRISYEIREAKSVYWPTTSSSQISLETLHYVPEGEETGFLDIFLCENKVCLKEEENDPFVLTSSENIVKELKFTPVFVTSTISSFQIEITVQPQNINDFLFTATTTASLRSH